MITTKIRRILGANRFGLGVLLLAWAIFFGHIFLGGNVFFLDDLKIIYYPLEEAYAEFQAAGELPVWSNEFGFGHPLLAWGQLGFFTPLHILLRVFGLHPLLLLQISIAGYFLLGLIGWYVLSRRRSYSEAASAITASVFVFGGFSIGHLNHVNFYTGTMVLPWLLLAMYCLVIRPSMRRAAWVSIAAAAITLSAQPQVVVFIFIAAAILAIAFIWEHMRSWTHVLQVTAWTIVAGVLALGLSSLAIFPLLEFVPDTERAEDLSRSELLEFSYPPSHAITLVLPYFYGNHASYWGAKGFQELAAFTGIIPLALAGGALMRRKNWRAEHVAGLLFVILGIVFALGRYSPVYRYLVEELILSSFGVVSRFVFFFNIGVALLAGAGAEYFLYDRNSKKWWFIFGAILFPIFLLFSFFRTLVPDSRELSEFLHLIEQRDVFIAITVVGILVLLVLFAVKKDSFIRGKAYILTFLSVTTIITYAWSYNPITPASVAFAESPLKNTLLEIANNDNIPPRLYSRPLLLQSEPAEETFVRFTDHISPIFSAYQPLPPSDVVSSCVLVPMEKAAAQTQGVLNIGLHNNPLEPAIETVHFPTQRVGSSINQRICFTNQLQSNQWISFTADFDSGIVIPFSSQTNPELQVYFVRTASPTEKEWARSQKPLQLLVEQEIPALFDEEAIILARHLNVVGKSSSARWIGALSIRSYRQFIEFFFANDSEPISGDNTHVIERNRRILDMSGITHVAQILSPIATDRMAEGGYEIVSESETHGSTARLYRNPQAYPKAFMVGSAVWKAAPDETRDAMNQPTYDPKQVVYLSGPKPPSSVISQGDSAFTYTAEVIEYTPTQVDIRTSSESEGYLVVTDSTTPQWQTYIDDQLSPTYIGNSVFKAAQVPAGDHIVSFRYHSPAIQRSIYATTTALIGVFVLLVWPTKKQPRQVAGLL